jgi:hypothetical protein
MIPASFGLLPLFPTFCSVSLVCRRLSLEAPVGAFLVASQLRRRRSYDGEEGKQTEPEASGFPQERRLKQRQLTKAGQKPWKPM